MTHDHCVDPVRVQRTLRCVHDTPTLQVTVPMRSTIPRERESRNSSPASSCVGVYRSQKRGERQDPPPSVRYLSGRGPLVGSIGGLLSALVLIMHLCESQGATTRSAQPQRARQQIISPMVVPELLRTVYLLRGNGISEVTSEQAVRWNPIRQRSSDGAIIRRCAISGHSSWAFSKICTGRSAGNITQTE